MKDNLLPLQSDDQDSPLRLESSVHLAVAPDIVLLVLPTELELRLNSDSHYQTDPRHNHHPETPYTHETEVLLFLSSGTDHHNYHEVALLHLFSVIPEVVRLHLLSTIPEVLGPLSHSEADLRPLTEAACLPQGYSADHPRGAGPLPPGAGPPHFPEIIPHPVQGDSDHRLLMG